MEKIVTIDQAQYLESINKELQYGWEVKMIIPLIKKLGTDECALVVLTKEDE